MVEGARMRVTIDLSPITGYVLTPRINPFDKDEWEYGAGSISFSASKEESSINFVPDNPDSALDCIEGPHTG